MTPDERFDYYTQPGPFGCLIWRGGSGRYGFFWHERKLVLAHRYAFERAHRKLNPGEHVCHTCDNPKCVSPAHLVAGTAAENSEDMVRKERSARGEQQHLAKLTAEDVLYIRASSASGVQLARELGVTKCTISSVRLRHSWKHV